MENVRKNSVRVSNYSVESSLASESSDDPRGRVKNYCRKVVTFMCTQVGVGGLIVSYAVIGAVGFCIIEREYNDTKVAEIALYRQSSLNDLWNVTKTYNILYKEIWSYKTEEVLRDFQQKVAKAVQNGYTTKTGKEMWEFPPALMFCLSVFTMIGYGNMVPRTDLGKVATMIYAVFGIPLYILYFKNMGKFLAHTFRWTYTWIYKCSVEKTYENSSYPSPKYHQQKKRIIVPSTACLWVLFAYVATGTIMFSSWQNWSVLDSVYFCITSLCKIGIGDFAPDNIFAGDNHTRLVVTFFYLLFGMGIIAMCFDLMREDVTVRIRNLKNDVGVCFEDIRLRAVDFYQRRNSLD